MQRESDVLTTIEPIIRIFAHGLAGAEVVGRNLCLYQFRWRKIGDIYRKAIVAVLERPICSFTPEQMLDLGDMLEACRGGVLLQQSQLHPRLN